MMVDYLFRESLKEQGYTEEEQKIILKYRGATRGLITGFFCVALFLFMGMIPLTILSAVLQIKGIAIAGYITLGAFVADLITIAVIYVKRTDKLNVIMKKS